MYRELNNKVLILIIAIGWSFFCKGQEQAGDTLPYHLFSNNPVVYTDLGFNTAPITLKYPFEAGIKRIKLKNNMSAIAGFGFSYKWFSLRLSLTIPGTIRSTANYGVTKYFGIGFDFTLKRVFFDADFHLYNGYSIKKADRWNDTLTPQAPNAIRPDILSSSLSLKAWFFQSKKFKMQAMKGKTGSYHKDVRTLYFKYSFNVYGIGSNRPIVPAELIDPTQSKTAATNLGAVDFAFVPGYAYIRRWRQFQIGAMLGTGIATQVKYYTYDDVTRSFLGLAFRYDFKFIAGYNQPKYFLMFVTDMDNKSVRFNNLVYRQSYYTLKLVGGYRFKEKKATQKDKLRKKILQFKHKD